MLVDVFYRTPQTHLKWPLWESNGAVRVIGMIRYRFIERSPGNVLWGFGHFVPSEDVSRDTLEEEEETLQEYIPQ